MSDQPTPSRRWRRSLRTGAFVIGALTLVGITMELESWYQRDLALSDQLQEAVDNDAEVLAYYGSMGNRSTQERAFLAEVVTWDGWADHVAAQSPDVAYLDKTRGEAIDEISFPTLRRQWEDWRGGRLASEDRASQFAEVSALGLFSSACSVVQATIDGFPRGRVDLTSEPRVAAILPQTSAYATAATCGL